MSIYIYVNPSIILQWFTTIRYLLSPEIVNFMVGDIKMRKFLISF